VRPNLSLVTCDTSTNGPSMHSFRFVVSLQLCICLFASDARAERVGFRFNGALQVPGSGTVSIFGINVPRNAPIVGTFAYDTATDVAGVGAAQVYPQLISSGFTLDISNGAIKLAASDYAITVADDNGSPTSDSFSVDYNYDSVGTPPVTPAKLLVNGVEWTGTKAFIKYYLSWDPATFDDSKLTADRPLRSDAAALSDFVGSSPNITPRFFSISLTESIVPPAGDYNFGGAVDLGDYVEWRHYFGTAASFADGNMNGVVDAADYVIWRNSTVSPADIPSIPEPSSVFLAFTWLSLLLGGIPQCPLGERRR
jgi:hypothetical protein